MRDGTSPDPRAAGGSGLRAAERLLRCRFGHARLRAFQRPIVEAMLRGDDLLAVLPTGAGKSLCFQLPAAMGSGVTLVVSPLIALMEDQVQALRRTGVSAAALTSATSARRRAEILQALRARGLRLLYVSPERLARPSFRRLAEALAIRRLVIDEAHCISEWGHDFRPAYLRIRTFALSIGRPPVAAFTATATPRTRSEIERSLGLREPRRFLRPVDRPNLRWEARDASDLRTALHEMHAAVRSALRHDPRACALVYVPTRARALRVAEAFGRLGLRAAPYHAGLSAPRRAHRQRAFIEGSLRVLCATSAFGMGIDHPRLRLVGHVGLPGSIEAYVQEAGRAGRDGAPAACLLLALPGDEAIHRSRIDCAWPAWNRVRAVWRALPAGRVVSEAELDAALGLHLEAGSVTGALRLLEECAAIRVLSPPRASSSRSPAVAFPPRGFLRCRAFPLDLLPRLRRGRSRARARFRHMRAYAVCSGCRRAFISRYFGEQPGDCRGCDRCRATFDRGERSIP